MKKTLGGSLLEETNNDTELSGVLDVRLVVAVLVILVLVVPVTVVIVP